MREIIGQRLKMLRNEAKLTQENVAKALNISREAYSLYETNKRQMNYDTICSISNLYDVSTDYILGNSSYRKSYNLCSEEAELLMLYRNADNKSKKIIAEVARISNE